MIYQDIIDYHHIIDLSSCTLYTITSSYALLAYRSSIRYYILHVSQDVHSKLSSIRSSRLFGSLYLRQTQSEITQIWIVV